MAGSKLVADYQHRVGGGAAAGPESESRAELDRFCDALIAIHGEIQAIESGQLDPRDNPLKNAPHTADQRAAARWDHPYWRETAAFPAPWLREHKFWPPVARIDNVYGDRNPVCTCVGMEAFASPVPGEVGLGQGDGLACA